MGDYASQHASEMLNQRINQNEDDVHRYDKDAAPIYPINFIDIKRKTNKAILIKLDMQVEPFSGEFYDTDYMWLPLAHVKIDEERKKILIASWLLQRKIDEQCSITGMRSRKT